MELSAFHVHGEPVPAAEAFAADYQPFSVGGSWGPAWDTTWFHIRGTVPDGWAGRQVALGFTIGNAGATGFGAEALIWRDGRPVQGLSPNHREYLLTPGAVGGEEVDLYVEAAANPPSPFGTNPWPLLLPEPDGAPLFTLNGPTSTSGTRTFDEFWHDFRVLVELMSELPDDSPQFARLCAGLERACNLLDLPDIADSWRRAQPVLDELLSERPAAPDTHSVSIIGHAHLDTAWLWPLRETIRKCARTFSTVLELMDRYPEYRFVVSQAQHLAWMRDHYPDLWDTDEGPDRRRAARADREHVGRGRLQHPVGRIAGPSDRLRQAVLPPTSSGSKPTTCGCPTSSATRRRCPRSCDGAASAGSSPRSCPGTSTTSFPTTASSGRASTARGSSPISPRLTPTTATSASASCGSASRTSRTTIGPPARSTCSAGATAEVDRPARCSSRPAASPTSTGFPA